ncbi:MAG: Lipoprotein signal peptidase [Myxococcaceae bacterium]|nr:Lipoprotein signal peptidase [Myxococcaceae bacterium]
MTNQEANGPRRNLRALGIMLVSLLVYTAADLGSKEWALDTLSVPAATPGAVCEPDQHGHITYQHRPSRVVPFVPGVLRFSYAENCGAAFSMLRSAPGWLRALVFGVAGVGFSIVLSAMFMRGAGGRAFAAAVPLIVSGAVGNLTDRLRHGFVVDFIQVDPKLFNYPIFNVADIAIAVGVALMLIDGVKKPSARPTTGPD